MTLDQDRGKTTSLVTLTHVLSGERISVTAKLSEVLRDFDRPMSDAAHPRTVFITRLFTVMVRVSECVFAIGRTR